MTSYNFHHGEVVLVPFPLSTPSPNMRRPALIASSDHYNSGTGEIIIAPITSRGRSIPRIGDYEILDWTEAGLLGPATVRARLVTLRSSHVLKNIGSLTRRDMEGVGQWLKRVLEL